jgi:hypothetical protein
MTLGDRPMVKDLSYRPWEVSTASIAALRAKLSSTPEQLIAEQVAAAIAELPAAKDGIDLEAVKQLIDEKLAAAAKVSQRRKPGPKADWRFVAAGEAYMFRREHGRMPSFKELAARCDDGLDSPLDETNTYKLLTYLGVSG